MNRILFAKPIIERVGIGLTFLQIEFKLQRHVFLLLFQNVNGRRTSISVSRRRYAVSRRSPSAD